MPHYDTIWTDAFHVDLNRKTHVCTNFVMIRHHTTISSLLHSLVPEIILLTLLGVIVVTSLLWTYISAGNSQSL